MPPTPSAVRKQPITLAQLSSYDDILTDALVDHACYWTTIPKNRPSYHASRGLTEEVIAKIIQDHLVVKPDLDVAESKLLATDALRKFYGTLRSPKEKEDFRAHLRRYMQIYLPDCPFEVNSTNRYTIFNHEAAVTARKFIRRGKPVTYLSGIQVMITEKEDKELRKRKKDFSIVVSARNKCAALFMGPARFANHDCAANARLMITGQTGIEIVATRDIEVGDEITVSYADSYFGEDNCECLCKTCEDNGVNGWSQAEDGVTLKTSIEEQVPAPIPEGYSLRRRRRDDSCASASRTPSVAPGIRPKIRKTKPRTLPTDGESPLPQGLFGRFGKRKRDTEMLSSPPITPAKKVKTQDYEDSPIPVSDVLAGQSSDSTSQRSNSHSDLDSTDALAMTDVTTPDEDVKGPTLQSPAPTPLKAQLPRVKREEPDVLRLPDLRYPSALLESQTASAEQPISTIEDVPQSMSQDTLASAAPPDGAPLPGLHKRSQIVDTPTSTQEIVEVVHPLPSADTLKPEDAQTEALPPRRRRGRPRKGESPRKPETTEENTAPAKKRTPGDYTLTPVLLSEPNTAWIYCTICNNPFVQQNAYYTRSACPRCERHSKLYGYQWPKTEKEGPNDEERILDHRTIHRFLHADDEAKIRGRKGPSYYYTPVPTDMRKAKRGRPRNTSESRLALDDDSEDYETPGSSEASDVSNCRRSGRSRNPSAKAAMS
ncbi:hypothetical protein F4780DRAFT_765981 [Xylariomycetidae sp. FL0641]|nr:hypothetical protein F4780DRAFT_765981 [Xylariomycetidae sp. FL0641]